MKIAVLGAGHVGPVIARLALTAGYEVGIAGSGDPARIEMITEFLAPGAVALTAADAVADADLVVLAIPWHRFPALEPAMFAGKVVIDSMNHWPPAEAPLGTSEDVARRLVGADVVKTLNHVAYQDMEPAGGRAVGIAGDSPVAVRAVAEFLERIGFDPVPVGSLAAGRLLEPGSPVFGVAARRQELENFIMEQS
ncbi:NAD(P)-binding domain-containing protein [Lentzea sp. BCCO 10_0798]|uniref:NAD(P)-binding domain-containing protein n=1 Tax=Lentzea kristufekii TaxID=3095430 RepID=A0ABU4U3A3_9PSEU|nr:NAD(P)-binding domain-containing protein [Lentzea sp. BCCO 10_0798]MDX8055055.1 NAD(P)-binding domain-containing protein [Lentzea sp. BCCO 10_0798]